MAYVNQESTVNKPRRATITEARPVRKEDDPCRFFADAGVAWIATDSAGRSFGASTESAARKAAEDYNAGRKSY